MPMGRTRLLGACGRKLRRRHPSKGAGMSQSRLMSGVESVTNVAVGYCVAVGTQLVVFPWFGVSLPLADNLLIGAVFTVVSLVRSYALRRLFNGWAHRG